MRRHFLFAAAIGTAAVLTLSACGGGSDADDSGDPSGAKPAADG